MCSHKLFADPAWALVETRNFTGGGNSDASPGQGHPDRVTSSFVAFGRGQYDMRNKFDGDSVSI